MPWHGCKFRAGLVFVVGLQGAYRMAARAVYRSHTRLRAGQP